MSMEKLNRAARAAGFAMAPPEELFAEPKVERVAGWSEAKHVQPTADGVRSGWLREMFSGLTQRLPA